MTWTADRVRDGEVHVRPDSDLVVHPMSEDCACGPTTEPVQAVDGYVGWIHVHHSLDGREQHEGV
jgi:hypothetical protein